MSLAWQWVLLEHIRISQICIIIRCKCLYECSHGWPYSRASHAYAPFKKLIAQEMIHINNSVVAYRYIFMYGSC